MERRHNLPIHLDLSHLALISIEAAQVVDGVECGCMLRAPCFLLSLQCPLVYLLGLSHLALISIENVYVVESPIRSRMSNPV